MAAMVCPTCGRAFSTAAARKAHLRTHTGEARDRRPASLSRSGIALIEPKEKTDEIGAFSAEFGLISLRKQRDLWRVGGDVGVRGRRGTWRWVAVPPPDTDRSGTA